MPKKRRSSSVKRSASGRRMTQKRETQIENKFRAAAKRFTASRKAIDVLASAEAIAKNIARLQRGKPYSQKWTNVYKNAASNCMKNRGVFAIRNSCSPLGPALRYKSAGLVYDPDLEAAFVKRRAKRRRA